MGYVHSVMELAAAGVVSAGAAVPESAGCAAGAGAGVSVEVTVPPQAASPQTMTSASARARNFFMLNPP